MAKPITFCKNHPTVRTHGRRLCESCYAKFLRSKPEYAEKLRARVRRYRTQHRKQMLARTAEYYREHSKELRAKAHERWHRLTADQKWEKNLKSTYGLTAAQYFEILYAQNKGCAICNVAPSPRKRLCVDHKHNGSRITRGAVRGLLCGKCNTLLGWVERHKDKLAKIESYLARH